MLLGDLPVPTEKGPLAMGPWRGKTAPWVAGLLQATLDQMGSWLLCRHELVRQKKNGDHIVCANIVKWNFAIRSLPVLDTILLSFKMIES